MIYLVTKNRSTPIPEWMTVIDYEKSLEIMNPWPFVQFDTETTGLSGVLDRLICIQFGYVNEKTNEDIQVVVDCASYEPALYKDFLENKRLIGHNLKFDLQFLYSQGIVPRHVCDTMIMEQLLYLGYKSKVSYNLHDVVYRRLGIELDKTYQTLIASSGLTDAAVKYAAYDVRYLQAVMRSQEKDAKNKECVKACQLENRAVPAIAYLEWCGIHLDVDKWKAKMKKDIRNREDALQKINKFISTCSQTGYVSDNGMINIPNTWFSNMTYTTGLGDLFTGEFDTTLHSKINWDSSTQTTPVLKKLGFDTTVKSKDTGEEKDTALMKHIEKQKGVCDEFLIPYLEYKKAGKVCTSYGQSYLNAINPFTGNINTTYRQLGTDTGRLACGSTQTNQSLATVKHLPTTGTTNPNLRCAYPQLQNLPHDEETRACFTAPPGYLMCACDYSSVEQRLAADIYDDQAMIDEYLHGSGDIHSLVCKLIHPEFKDLTTAEIKKNHKAERQAAKPVGLGINYGASPQKLAETIGCSLATAQDYYDKYMKHFKGVAAYMKKAEKFVKKNGYILICPETGHKAWWPDWGTWKEEQLRYTPEFWEEYNQFHKGTGDAVAMEVNNHMKKASAWTRKAVNSPCQGLSAIITKKALTEFFNWLVDDGQFGKVRIVNAVHDEIVITFPNEEKDTVPKKLKEIMEEVGNQFCHKVPIIAEASTGTYWIH